MSVDPFDKDVPTITLDAEDREAFQRSRQKSTSNYTAPSDTSEPSAQPPSSGSSGFLTFIIFILALSGASASGWLIYKNIEQETLLLQSQARITDLENQLSATGEEMGSSAAAIQTRVSQLSAKTEELWGQMDKLWASAWRRNQKEINDLSRQLTNDTADMKKLIAGVQTEMSVGTTNTHLLQEKLDQQVTQLQSLSTLVEQSKEARANIENQLLELAGLIANTELAITELARQVSTNQSNIKRTQTPPQTVPQLPTPVGVSPTEEQP